MPRGWVAEADVPTEGRGALTDGTTACCCVRNPIALYYLYGMLVCNFYERI